MPSPNGRSSDAERDAAAARQRRSRAHRAGDHSRCGARCAPLEVLGAGPPSSPVVVWRPLGQSEWRTSTSRDLPRLPGTGELEVRMPDGTITTWISAEP